MNDTSDKINLTDVQKNELISGIANDIYRRATVPQAIQLIQTQCTNQAKDIVENATDEELKGFIQQLDQAKAAATQAAPEAPVDEAEPEEKSEETSEES